MASLDWNSPYHRVVHRALAIASESECRCRPVHLLSALSELQDPIGAALTPPDGSALLPSLPGARRATGGTSSYLSMQTMQAASRFADDRAEALSPPPASPRRHCRSGGERRYL